MTDQELIESVAETVMGWHKHHDPNLKYWVNNKFAIQMLRDDFNPLTNANHWIMVVDRMKELNFSTFILNRWPNGTEWDARFVFNRSYFSSTPGHAVCLAALKTMEGNT